MPSVSQAGAVCRDPTPHLRTALALLAGATLGTLSYSQA